MGQIKNTELDTTGQENKCLRNWPDGQLLSNENIKYKNDPCSRRSFTSLLHSPPFLRKPLQYWHGIMFSIPCWGLWPVLTRVVVQLLLTSRAKAWWCHIIKLCLSHGQMTGRIAAFIFQRFLSTSGTSCCLDFVILLTSQLLYRSKRLEHCFDIRFCSPCFYK